MPQHGADVAIVDLPTAEQAPRAVRFGADQTNGETASIQRFVVGLPGRMAGVAHGRAVLEVVSTDGTLTIGSAYHRDNIENRGLGHGSLLVLSDLY